MPTLADLQTYPPFRPFLGWGHPHLQTIVGNLVPGVPAVEVTAKNWQVPLPDGDILVVKANQPLALASQPQRLVIAIHGLSGCSQASYMQRLAQAMVAEGHICWRMNLRGCGPGRGLAVKTYHSGQVADLAAVVARAHRAYPEAAISIIGYSLGGNLALKWAGLVGAGHGFKGLPDTALAAVDSVIGVSPPLDLAAALAKMSSYRWFPYHWYFTRRLKSHVGQMKALFAGHLDDLVIPKGFDLQQFDHQLTAPLHGFAGAADYYDKASCGPYLKSIRHKTLVIMAADDPIVDAETLQALPRSAAVAVHLAITGGHLGFWGRGYRSQSLWLPGFLQHWVGQLPMAK